MISVLELFSIGIGPSSSHTMGPMRAARTYVEELRERALLTQVHRIRVDLYGSLGATGRGHGSDKAVILGLLGDRPETVNPDTVDDRIDVVATSGILSLGGYIDIAFRPSRDITLHLRKSLAVHPNGMAFAAMDKSGELLHARTFYSVGGGFVVSENDLAHPTSTTRPDVPFPFSTAGELLAICTRNNLPISEVVRRNELAHRSEEDLLEQLLGIWAVMKECVANGFSRDDAVLPGGLHVRRRAPRLYKQLMQTAGSDPFQASEWVSLFALAVGEENASGGRVVTAPTNGAAGIIPAVLHYYEMFLPGANSAGVVRFLLAASAIGILFKANASISGAEMGCQGEVGTACSMAAAGLAEVLGGTPAQVENAAEIGIEHNLGLTCDPVGGLVQIPCIERNAIASNKAIVTARMALLGDGTHRVSLDQAIRTMRDTGIDMKSKYKETSRGGLAVNAVDC